MTTPELAAAQPPRTVAGYRIDGVLGRGGMSVVYLGYSPNLSRLEALKVLSTSLLGNGAARSAFSNEAVTTAALAHPNIVTVFNRGETHLGQPWISMEYIAGRDAEKALRENTMTPAKALHIVTEVARALDFAHSHNVIHQDVKPANVLLGSHPGGNRDRVVLADFGAAMTVKDITTSSERPLVASFAYTAPEVINGDHDAISGYADVYSLGCTLFRLLTRSYPFPGHDSIAALADAQLTQPAPRISTVLPWATEELDDVIGRALSKRPADRFDTAGELAAAATHAMRGPRHARVAVRAAPATPPPRIVISQPAATATRSPGRRRWLLAGTVCTAVVAVALLAWWLSRPEPPVETPSVAPPGPATATNASTSPVPTHTPVVSLTAMIPAGYPPGACTPQPPAMNAAAAISCGPNLDPGGPLAATYTLSLTVADLQNALTDVTARANPVVCPGNIQSPGPWRRVADPAQQPQGTVFCGFRDGRPMVAWTSEAQRFLATITTETPDPHGLDELYTWWTTHS